MLVAGAVAEAAEGYWLASCGLLCLPSYRTQNPKPRNDFLGNMPPNGGAGVRVGEEPCVCWLVPVGLELTETLLPLLP